MNSCGDSNFTVSNNGLIAEDYTSDESVTYSYDFATKAVNTLSVSTILDTLNGYPNILDVDVKNKRFAAYVNDYDTDETTLGIYDLMVISSKSLRPWTITSQAFFLLMFKRENSFM
ncbi:hypothetical protein [Bacillus salipaludis]|uniref:Uncharacterized protein n=1 Tax=Bacillus salipaludis TaxID=2547811 RepID=A0ABW8RPY6_9BACI